MIGRVGGEQADVLVEPGRARVVVAGARCARSSGCRPSSLRTTSAVLLCVLRPVTPNTTWAPTFSSSRDQCRLRSSSKRAFSSITQATCLPASAAADQRLHERRVVADPVDGHLDRHRLRVVGGLADEALDARVEAVVRVVEQDVGRCGSRRRCRRPARLEPGRRQRRPGRVAQRRRRRGRRSRTASCSRAGRSSRRRPPAPSAKRSTSSATIAGSASGCTSSRTTGSKRRCRSSSLDHRPLAEPVVLVELDLGVAADPEQAGAGDDHSREELARRSPRITWSRPTNTRSDELDAARTRSHCGQLARHLDPHEHRLAADRILEPERPRGREVRDVRERVRGIEAERRQHRRDLGARTRPRPRRAGPSSRSSQPPGGSRARPAAGAARRGSSAACSSSIEVTIARIRASQRRAAPARPGRSRVGQPRHALHEELVEVRAEDGQELDALEQRRALVQRLMQHPPVELEPADVAVDPGAAQVTVSGPGIWLDHDVMVGRRGYGLISR